MEFRDHAAACGAREADKNGCVAYFLLFQCFNDSILVISVTLSLKIKTQGKKSNWPRLGK